MSPPSDDADLPPTPDVNADSAAENAFHTRSTRPRLTAYAPPPSSTISDSENSPPTLPLAKVRVLRPKSAEDVADPNAPTLDPPPDIARMLSAIAAMSPAGPQELTLPVSRKTTTTPNAPSVPVATSPSLTNAAARPADCDSGGDRALRVAKPGALGALLGAGLGAASGAIANGGKGAGKGALIGGVAGAALGTGYGAYKTKNECGTIFGSSDRPASRVITPGRAGATPGVAGQRSGRDEVTAPLQASQASENAERIQVYSVR